LRAINVKRLRVVESSLARIRQLIRYVATIGGKSTAHLNLGTITPSPYISPWLTNLANSIGFARLPLVAKQVNINESKTNLSHLIERAAAAEEIIAPRVENRAPD
jgi:hypothetical protein